jgi:hypothetical protein
MHENSYWHYVGLVTPKEALNKLKSIYIFTLAGAFFFLLFYGIGTWVDAFSSALFHAIPKWVKTWIFISILLLFINGQKIELPKFDVRLWLVYVVCLFLFISSIEFLPWWAAAAIIWVLGIPVLFLDRLIEIGREKVHHKKEGDTTA